MSRKERQGPRALRIRALLDAGDHGAAAGEARRLLADAAATDGERAEAGAILASLAPERGAVLAGALGLAAALALTVLVLVRG